MPLPVIEPCYNRQQAGPNLGWLWQIHGLDQQCDNGQGCIWLQVEYNGKAEPDQFHLCPACAEQLEAASEAAQGSFWVKRLSVQPVVGLAVTFWYHSDQHPGTITRVVSDKRIEIQEDHATLIGGDTQTESQEYSYAPDPQGRTYVVTKRKDGRWQASAGGPKVALGFRRKYHDPSF